MIIELYRNRTLGRDIVLSRWSPHPSIIVGGSINTYGVEFCSTSDGTMSSHPNDWRHIRDDLDCRSVLNMEIEQTDVGKGPGMALGEFGFLDNSGVYPADRIRDAVAWASREIARGRMYIHCFAGGGRSATLAYAVLRACLGKSRTEATQAIRDGKPWRFEWNGSLIYGSITEWPTLQWGDAPLGSAAGVAAVEAAIA